MSFGSRWALWAILVGSVPPAHAGTETATATRVAVVVGYNGSAQAGRPDLRFADDDAARFFELLAPGMKRAWLLTQFDDLSQEVFSALVPVARVPTLAALQGALLEANTVLEQAKARGERTELVFAYAGHGDVLDGVGYVNLEGSRLSRSDFEALVLTGVAADRKHIVIDACRSYFLVSSRGPGGKRAPTLGPYAGPRRRSGVGYILSTSSDAESHEWASFQGGIFSHEIRSALSGAADLDGDGTVDYQELAAFVAVANEGIPQARYRPRFFIQPPSEDKKAAVFRPSELKARWLELSPPIEGRVRVTDHRGIPYADLHKAAGETIKVALVHQGIHTVDWNQRRWRMDGATERAELSSLPDAPPEVAARTQPHEAFRFLFTTAMSEDVLRGWRLGSILKEPAPPPPERPFAWVPPVLVGSGLALAAGGTALVVAGAQTRADLADPNLSQAARASQAEDGDTLVISGIATASTGLVLSAVGGWLWATR